MVVPDTRIGVTLYNFRNFCQDKKSLDETLNKVKDTGYQAVQVSGVGNIRSEDIAELLVKHQFYCCITHENLEMYTRNIDTLIAKLQKFGAPYTALGFPGKEYFVSGGAQKLAELLNQAGKRLKESGISLGYHNHHWELNKFGGKTFLDTLFCATEPDNLFFEIDAHWIQRGGGDPAQWIRKAKDRCHVLHLKDYGMDGDNPAFSEIGEGNLNWEAILSACAYSHPRWLIVEQDDPVAGRDIFQSMKISLRNLNKMGIH